MTLARYVGTFLAAMLCLTQSPAHGEDWPQWRHDAARSGATDDSCADQMVRLWTDDFGTPDPAYDHQYRMCADASYMPVAAQGLLFVPSNTEDCVRACDLKSGRTVWQFTTEGPIRTAPAYSDGRVYFGSDDGYLYCVEATRGELLWRRRGVPEGIVDGRMLVNDRLVSRWPVRGAPVVAERVVFFGAGIWPEEGVYVTAVSAETGDLLWQNDRMSFIEQGMSDHGKPYDLGLPPQGYPAIIDGKLAVSSGRSLAAWFDLQSGQMEPYTCYYVKLAPPRGTWFVSGVGQYCVQGGNWFGTRPDALPPVPAELEQTRNGTVVSTVQPEDEATAARIRPFFNAPKYKLHNENLYSEPVLTETTVYASEWDDPEKSLIMRGHTHLSYPGYDRIVACDLTRPQWKLVREQIHLYPEGTFVRRLEFPVLWELETPLRVMIKAGDRLFAAGPDTIAAIAIPAQGDKPEIVWQAPVDGNPVTALVVDGRLVVSTDTGKIHCFGTGPGTDREVFAKGTAEAPSVPSQGYAICIGDNAERQARRLVEAGQYRVVLLEADAARAATIRQRLTADGISANQVQVLHWTPEVDITPYWANLVLCGNVSSFGADANKLLGQTLDCLRPFTGTMQIASTGPAAIIAERDGYEVQRTAAGLLVQRTAPPTGSAQWTHEAGGPENAFSSSDSLVKWPLATLWYSGQIDREFTPAAHFQHERHPFPLVTQGRMFIITYERLHAVDIYTGRYLWQAEMPMTEWVQTRYQDSRMYGRPVDRNYVATDDSVYVILEHEIHVYATENGEKTAVLPIPKSIVDVVFNPRWTEVRTDGQMLFAVVGDRLLAMDRSSGELLWDRQSTLGATTYALGGGELIGLDYAPFERGGAGKAGTTEGPMFTLDPATGRTIWSRQVTYDTVPKYEIQHERPWLLPANPEVAYNAKHELIVLSARRNAVQVFQAADGTLVWKKAGAGGNFQRIYSPVVTDDHLVLSNYMGFFGYVLDLQTGEDRGDAGIPRPRTCARILGNNNLLMYRDAATELYDIDTKQMIGINSVRSGCTTSFIPAGGIVTAPMLGHGCVCNYPMFASLAMYHSPESEQYRPAIVSGSWENQAELPENSGGVRGARNNLGMPVALTAKAVSVESLKLFDATVEPLDSCVVVSSIDKAEGYAIQRTKQPLTKAVFTVAIKKASGAGRHGNAFFVLGAGDSPEDRIECRLYYGGRGTLSISGENVEPVEVKVAFGGQQVFTLTVAVDCDARTIVCEAGAYKAETRITGDVKAITRVGYGGANSDNIFSAVDIQ